MNSTPKSLARASRTLQPLAVPDLKHRALDSPTAMPYNRLSPPALSSASAPIRSPMYDGSALSRFPTHPQNQSPHSHELRRSSHALNNGNTSESHVFSDSEVGAEEHGFRDLNLSDEGSYSEDHPPMGRTLKRRAPSPTLDGPREDRSPGGGHNLYHKRSMQMLNNPHSQRSPSSSLPFHAGSNSFSSAASSFAPSYGSTWSHPSLASSATSYNSDRISPNALSPATDSDFGPISPFPRPFNESEQANMKGEPPRRMRGGKYVCECCIKKRKVFDSLAELRYIISSFHRHV